MKPPDLPCLLPSISRTIFDYPLLKIHISQILHPQYHHDDFAFSITPETISHSRVSDFCQFQKACYSVRFTSSARELPSLSFLLESSGFRIQCTLYTASIPLSHPLPLYYPQIRGFRMPSCCGLGGFRNYPMWPLMKDSMIKGFRLLNCSAPAVSQLQPPNCRGYYGYLLTEIALWRLFPSSDSGKKNDDNSGCILLEFTGSYGCMCTGCRFVRWLLLSLLAFLLFKVVAFGTVNCIFSPNCMLIIIKIMNTLLCSSQYSSLDRLLSITHSLGLKNVWNVQGAKKAQGLKEVKILKCTVQPDILFLIETMTNEKNSRSII
ncbi:hypothetical protein Cgig2_025707 [Carnegiea gigantea]|uniref:Uncharacterized protein n=1 Tax=Carnegiea gigantea TaxID=171969 RepID=A0A9Q1K4I9_9CARY|nr:hypothetical protein Cgig2_025707 [Carnegiea gigantea]